MFLVLCSSWSLTRLFRETDSEAGHIHLTTGEAVTSQIQASQFQTLLCVLCMVMAGSAVIKLKVVVWWYQMNVRMKTVSPWLMLMNIVASKRLYGVFTCNMVPLHIFDGLKLQKPLWECQHEVPQELYRVMYSAFGVTDLYLIMSVGSFSPTEYCWCSQLSYLVE